MAAAVESPIPPIAPADPEKAPAQAALSPLPKIEVKRPKSQAAEPAPTTAKDAPSDAKPSPPTPAEDDGVIDGIRYTLFAHPSPATQIPVPAPLTTEQETQYNSVHNQVSSWSTVPVSIAADAEHAPITEEEQEFLTRECLLRYLRATKWKVADAVQRLQQTLAWRREYDMAGLTPEATQEENATGKQWVLGYDNAGRPCHYLNPARQNTPRSDRQIRHLVFMLERAVDLLPPGQETIVLLINFAESSKGQGASFQQGRQALYILQNHYPERLGKALLCNLPWHFWAFMKLVTPFIDPQTRNKIVYNEEMRRHVPPEQLRKSHGGDLEFEYDHAKYWPAFVHMAEERRKERHERWVQAGKRVGEFEAYLRGGQEQCLRDAQKRSSKGSKRSETGETDSQLRKSVAISEDSKPGNDE